MQHYILLQGQAALMALTHTRQATQYIITRAGSTYGPASHWAYNTTYYYKGRQHLWPCLTLGMQHNISLQGQAALMALPHTGHATQHMALPHTRQATQHIITRAGSTTYHYKGRQHLWPCLTLGITTLHIITRAGSTYGPDSH